MRATRDDVHRWFLICELSLLTAGAVLLVWKYREPLLLALPTAAFILLASAIWSDWLHQHGLSGADAVILLLVSGYDLIEWLNGHTAIGILVGLLVGAVLGRMINRIIRPPTTEQVAERELRRMRVREKFEQKRKANITRANSTPKWLSELFPWLCAAAFFFYPWRASDYKRQFGLFAYLILRTIIIRRFPPAISRINAAQPHVPLQNGDSL